ncbi:MAG TPA: hypothetical protein VFQ22_03295 [Longimicrobiales bacterium]|nr:hypothetical protein [Longimicrobiales bacterium]
MRFQVTVRYGAQRQRYHAYAVEGEDARAALAAAAEQMPERIAAEADLIELRVAVEPDARSFLGG